MNALNKKVAYHEVKWKLYGTCLNLVKISTSPHTILNIDRQNNRLFTQTYGNHIVDKYCFTIYI